MIFMGSINLYKVNYESSKIQRCSINNLIIKFNSFIIKEIENNMNWNKMKNIMIIL